MPIPSWPSLAQRQRLPELMDQPGLDPELHAQALVGLRRINAVSFSAASLFAPIRALARSLPPGAAPLRLLDVACGGGDNALDLAALAQRHGLNLAVEGCDISPQAVVLSQARARERGVEASFFVADVLADSLPDRFDVIVSSLFLHHLDTADAETLLARLAASSRRLLLISDLLRTPLGYGLALAGTQLLSRSPIVHIDGLLSVRGAFQMHEVAAMAERAGLEGVDLRRCWPERYLLRWSPPRAVPPPTVPTPAVPTPGGTSA
jgi:2-polyprenyl-3-methyl-5-hydroxy-6-metoxy-1,4-benzoquinol methylase